MSCSGATALSRPIAGDYDPLGEIIYVSATR